MTMTVDRARYLRYQRKLLSSGFSWDFFSFFFWDSTVKYPAIRLDDGSGSRFLRRYYSNLVFTAWVWYMDDSFIFREQLSVLLRMW